MDFQIQNENAPAEPFQAGVVGVVCERAPATKRAVKSPEQEAKEADFKARTEQYTKDHVKPVSAALAAYLKNGHNRKAVAHQVLTATGADLDLVARMLIRCVAISFLKGDSFTAAARRAGSCVIKETGYTLSAVEGVDPEDAPKKDETEIACGMVLLDRLSQATGAFSICQMNADRPNKVAGGVKVQLAYELRANSDTFFETAMELGKVGMPTFTKEVVADWRDQKTGGAPGQPGGMVHGGGRVMKGVTAVEAPRLFEAQNAMQSVRFRVNPVTRAVVQDYDDVKAFNWLLEHFKAEDAKAPKEKQLAVTLRLKARSIVLRKVRDDTVKAALEAGVPDEEAAALGEAAVEALTEEGIEALIDAAIPDLVTFALKAKAGEAARL